MNIYTLLVNAICRMIITGRISIFDLSQSLRYSESRFYICEITHIKRSGRNYEETLKRILFELTEINDILGKEIKLSELFQYCEANGMLSKSFNPFYRRQRESVS